MVLVRVVPEVVDALPFFVLAKTGRRTPGELEWQPKQQKDKQSATHGASLSMTSV